MLWSHRCLASKQIISVDCAGIGRKPESRVRHPVSRGVPQQRVGAQTRVVSALVHSVHWLRVCGLQLGRGAQCGVDRPGDAAYRGVVVSLPGALPGKLHRVCGSLQRPAATVERWHVGLLLAYHTACALVFAWVEDVGLYF